MKDLAKVLKHEFLKTFDIMTKEFIRLYPQIFEDKIKKFSRFTILIRDNYNYKLMAEKTFNYLKPYENDLKNKNTSILSEIILFDNLIDFKVFNDASNERKLIILDYIYQYYQCFHLSTFNDSDTLKKYFKDMDENSKNELTDIIVRIKDHPTIQDMIKDVERETEKRGMNHEELLADLLTGKPKKQTKQLVKKLGNKYKDKIINDTSLQEEISPLISKVQTMFPNFKK